MWLPFTSPACVTDRPSSGTQKQMIGAADSIAKAARQSGNRCAEAMPPASPTTPPIRAKSVARWSPNYGTKLDFPEADQRIALGDECWILKGDRCHIVNKASLAKASAFIATPNITDDICAAVPASFHARCRRANDRDVLRAGVKPSLHQSNMGEPKGRLGNTTTAIWSNKKPAKPTLGPPRRPAPIRAGVFGKKALLS
jgi:hypothetical protein